MESLTVRWSGTEYELVLEKLNNLNLWPKECGNMKESLKDLLIENDETTLIEEGEDILDGLELMMDNKEEGMTMETLMDVTEIITTLLIWRSLTGKKIAQVFQKAEASTSERIKRIDRTEGMKKMRDELMKLSIRRIKDNLREQEFQDIEIGVRKRRECSSRMERGELRSQEVENKYVQDVGSKLAIVGSDVEALYPSLEAIEVA